MLMGMEQILDPLAEVDDDVASFFGLIILS
jgi:hypothetical protein